MGEGEEAGEESSQLKHSLSVISGDRGWDMKLGALLSLLAFCLSSSILATPQVASTQVAAASAPQQPHWTDADRERLLVKAKSGDQSSQMWLGAAYEQGWFGKANFQETLKWFRRAAAQGDPDAQNALGQMYQDGEGVKQDYAEAAKWFRLAAEHTPDSKQVSCCSRILEREHLPKRFQATGVHPRS
jgi:Sel1 repeat